MGSEAKKDPDAYGLEVMRKNMPPPSRALPKAKANYAAHIAVRRAGELAVMVRDESRETIAAFLDPLDRQNLYALVVALAAMVPDDVPQADLLAWVDELDQPALMAAAS